VLPNHGHLVLCPEHYGDLSEHLRWLTVTHPQRWHARRHTAVTGPVYQGRFKTAPSLVPAWLVGMRARFGPVVAQGSAPHPWPVAANWNDGRACQRGPLAACGTCASRPDGWATIADHGGQAESPGHNPAGGVGGGCRNELPQVGRPQEVPASSSFQASFWETNYAGPAPVIDRG
jgi:hypothetical protein